MQAFSRQEQDCVEAALHCHKTCLGMAMTHCLDEGGEHVAPQHFRLMIDCAAICATAADFIMHKSQFHRQMAAQSIISRKCCGAKWSPPSSRQWVIALPRQVLWQARQASTQSCSCRLNARMSISCG